MKDLPVVTAARTPDDLPVAANRAGEGGFSVPAVFQIRFDAESIKDVDGLLNERLG